MLVIDKGIVEACMKDIEETFYSYEYLQREIHDPSPKRISRFTERLSSPAKRLVSEVELPFARCFSQAVIRVIISIAESSDMILSVSQIKQMSIRPCTQFFQSDGNITRTIKTPYLSSRILCAGCCACYACYACFAHCETRAPFPLSSLFLVFCILYMLSKIYTLWAHTLFF